MKIKGSQIGSVLAFLLLSKAAFAYQYSAPLLVLTERDSRTLLGRMKFAPKVEIYRSTKLITKRFSTSDGAVRIDCGQHAMQAPNYPVVCSVTLDSTKSAPGVTEIRSGFVENSIIFKILAKKDVQTALDNMIYSAGAFVTSETVTTKDGQGRPLNVVRFYLNCPRDWVFDVVACDGHIITR